MMKVIYLILFILISCHRDTSSESCDELSMQKFRGVPMANKRFEEKCQNAKIHYTREVCQSALAELMQSQNLNEVKEKFGNPVVGCFTEADLKRFHKK